MEKIFKDYIIKSYYKTGSLISNSCRGVCVIAQENSEVQTSAFNFGKHIGNIDIKSHLNLFKKELLSN